MDDAHPVFYLGYRVWRHADLLPALGVVRSHPASPGRSSSAEEAGQIKGSYPINKTLKAIAIALALAGATAIGAANAAEIVFNPGNVAHGYNDGYWTRTHEWNTWAKPEYRTSYRASTGAKYFEWGHDRDANHGWLGDRH